MSTKITKPLLRLFTGSIVSSIPCSYQALFISPFLQLKFSFHGFFSVCFFVWQLPNRNVKQKINNNEYCICRFMVRCVPWRFPQKMAFNDSLFAMAGYSCSPDAVLNGIRLFEQDFYKTSFIAAMNVTGGGNTPVYTFARLNALHLAQMKW